MRFYNRPRRYCGIDVHVKTMGIAAKTALCPFKRRRSMRRTLIAVMLGAFALGGAALAQTRRSASPPGSSATEVGGKYDVRAGYVGGKWIEIRYGRPIKRGRDLFGPPEFADAL